MKEVLENSKNNMVFKKINFYENLGNKEKASLFYPGLILNLASYKNYPIEDGKELALISQLLYYSIEIHEKIFLNNDSNNLVILAGDYLYSQVFKKITKSVFLQDIVTFTNYIKNFSEKRILSIEGCIDESEVVFYKYAQISKIVTKIVTNDDEELIFLSEELSKLYISFIKDTGDFEKEKNSVLVKYSENVELTMYIENIIAAMEGVTSEQ